MYKIKSVLCPTEKDQLEAVDDYIEVHQNICLSKKRSSNSLQEFLKSIANKHVLNINYFANHSQENTSRNIETNGIDIYASSWHLIAFCHLRKDYRDFRIDRIT